MHLNNLIHRIGLLSFVLYFQVPFSYELQNGDVVSILTGEGKPSTDWMRYAKSRSTRSKLRSYFRAKQKERYVFAQISRIFDLRNTGLTIPQLPYFE